jgi:peptidylprolyl isomerase
MDIVDAVRGEPPSNPTKILQASLASEHKPRPVPLVAQPLKITADQLTNSHPN